MNSESGKKLSMDELKRLNSTQSIQTSSPLPTHPTQQEWDELLDMLEQMDRRMVAQTALLRELLSRAGAYPTQTQTTALAQDVAAIRESLTQAGKKKEKRFSIPRISLPRLHLPEWDGPTVVTILMALAVLFLMWWAWGGDWSSLSLLSL